MPTPCHRCPDTSDGLAPEAIVSPDLAALVEAREPIHDVVRARAVYLGQVAKPLYFSPETALEWNVPLGRVLVVEGQLHLLLKCVPVCARCFLSLLPLRLRESVGSELLDGGGGAGA